MEVRASSLLGSELVAEVFESAAPVPRASAAAPTIVREHDLLASVASEERRVPGIDTTPVNAVASFEVFMGRRYDPAERDGDSISTQPALRPSRDGAQIAAIAAFVDAAVHGRKRAPADAALAPSVDTPLRRYQHLLVQVAALERDLAGVDPMAARVQPSKDMLRLLVTETTALTARLQCLGGAAAAAELHMASAAGLPATDAPLYDSLQQLADSLRSAPAATTAASALPLDDTATTSIALVELEQRMAALETGTGAAAGTVIPVDIQSRLAALEADMLARDAAAAGGTDSAGSAAAHARLQHAVQTLEAWDAQSAAVPWLVSRLACLDPIVRTASLLPARLAAMEAAAVQATELLEADHQLMTEVQAGLADMAAALAVQLRGGRT